LLFRCFDFNRKGSLRLVEMSFMLSTCARALRRFVQLDEEFEDIDNLKAEASQAFVGHEDGEIRAEGFRAWFRDSAMVKRLREFLDQHALDNLPDEMETPVQREFRLRDYRTQELVGQVRQMKAKVAAMEGETVEWTVQEQRQVDALKKRTQELLKKLVVATETLQSELQELSSSLNYNLARGGAAALMEPSTKFRHDQLLNEITVLERRAREDCGEAVGLVERLMEFTYGQPDVTTKESDDETPVYRPKSPDQQFFRQQRVIDREARRQRGITHLGGGPQKQPSRSVSQVSLGRREFGEELEPESMDMMPRVVAFADYIPVHSHETQLLTLREGDEIIATGRDVGGWWYGKNVKTNEEGWFPPSFVQPKAAIG